MSRPPTWPERITAPGPAMKVYRAIARSQEKRSFTLCHVYDGASRGELPVIYWEGKITGLARVVGAFMGLEISNKTCKTPGCMNPFHYLKPGNLGDTRVPVERVKDKAPPIHIPIAMGEYIELVQWHIDEKEILNPTFDQLRELIPIEDMSNEILQKAINEINI